MSADSMLYAYGIVRHAGEGRGPSLPAAEGIVAGAQLRALPHRALAAIVSELPCGAGSMSLEQELRDADRAKAMILGHHRVMQALIGEHTVVPFRFGAMFADAAGLRAALDRHYDTLRETLERVEGALEWGVKIFCDRAAAAARVGEEAATAATLRRQIDHASEGRGFFLRKGLQRAIDAEVESAVRRFAEESHGRFAGIARSAAELDLQPSAIGSRSDEIVFNGAYLVDRGREKDLFAAVEALAVARGSYGLNYERNGPWPPYSFSNCRVAAGADGGRDGT